jgi:hypothetical protein
VHPSRVVASCESPEAPDLQFFYNSSAAKSCAMGHRRSMKRASLANGSMLLTAFLVTIAAESLAGASNELALEVLISRYLPACRLELGDDGNRKILKSESGEILDLAAAAHENPNPRDDVIGYWYSPAMDFLARQKIKVATADPAVGAVQLLHTIAQGPKFVQQKAYEARQIPGGWVVDVEHDFANYPSSVQQINPYELLVDSENRVSQFRQRCYAYRGSAKVYTNTVISVYQRELKLDGGRYYPEHLYEELQSAWERENNHPNSEPQKKDN